MCHSSPQHGLRQATNNTEGVEELVHGLLFIQRQTCYKGRSPAICHLPTCPVATQASGKLSIIGFTLFSRNLGGANCLFSTELCLIIFVWKKRHTYFGKHVLFVHTHTHTHHTHTHTHTQTHHTRTRAHTHIHTHTTHTQHRIRSCLQIFGKSKQKNLVF
jgi:hypothetical protein